jgi:enoyl-CoA hydratase/carnithine racemase
MGGGMGLAQGAALRIVSERSRVAMPETGIGLVPDVGASHFLSKMQVELALYLGLTGVTLQAEDAVCSGLADLVWSSERMAGIESWLADLAWGEDPLTTLTAALATAGAARPYEAPLLAHLSAIHRHFSPARDVADLMASLAQAGAPDAAWREATLRLLQTRSPLMMCVTRALLLRGRRCDLADSFRMELNVVQHAFDIGDFIEGTRALIVDKDNRPQWRVGDAASCGAAQVDAFFAPRWLASAHPLRRLGAAGG